MAKYIKKGYPKGYKWSAERTQKKKEWFANLSEEKKKSWFKKLSGTPDSYCHQPKSEETRSKMSEAAKGVKKSEQHKENMRIAAAKITPETRLKANAKRQIKRREKRLIKNLQMLYEQTMNALADPTRRVFKNRIKKLTAQLIKDGYNFQQDI